MATAKKTQIVITANAAVAKKVMDELQQRIDVIKQKMAALDTTTKQGQREFRKLEKELVSYNSAVVQNVTNTERIKNAINNLSGTSLKELKRALSAAKSELGKMSSNSKGLKDMQHNIQTLQAQIDKVTGSVHKQGNAWSTALRNLTAYVGLFAVFNQLKSMLTGIIQKNFEMSDSLADIRKVSGLLSKEIETMTSNLAKIDTRTSLQELNRIAYAGAKLGIGEYGAAGLESFVRASNQVNVALKEDLGDEALTALAKITEVMGLIPKMGVEQSMLKTGSAIFKLASTTTATSGKIIDFSNRLLAMGKVGALSTSDILALGAAVDAMAMEPEVASTAFSKMITEMRKGTASMEHDLGLAKDSLKNLLESGKGIEALQMVFHKMHDTGNVFALDSLFKDLGSDGARLIKVMVTMADKVDMLDKMVRTSNDAFVEGMAVTQEYNIQQETAQGILERANSMFSKAFVNPDGVNAVKSLAVAWYDFSRAMTTSASAQASFLTTVKILIASCKTLIYLLPEIIGFLVGRSMVLAIANVKRVVIAIYEWVVAQKALNATMAANVFGMIASVLALIYTQLRKNSEAAKQAADSMDRFTKSLSEAESDVGKALLELDGFKDVIKNTKKGTDEHRAAIENFNKKFGSYISNLLTEKSTAEDMAKAYNEAALAIERKVMAQHKEKDIEQHVAPKAGREVQRLYEYDQQARNNGNPQYNGKWLRAFVNDRVHKKSLEATIEELIMNSGVGWDKNEDFREGLFEALRNTNGTPAGFYNVALHKKRSTGGEYIEHTTGKFSNKEKQVAMGVAYIRQRFAREKSMDEVKEKFKNYPDTLLMEDVEPVTVGDGEKDKGGGKDPNKSAAEMAKTRANAVIANIKAFYEEQMRKYLEWVTKVNADGEKLSEGQQKEQINYLQSQMETALGKARQSIATLDDGWKQFYPEMFKDVMVTTDETSKQLLESIGKSDIEELHNLFSKLSADLSRENNLTLSENLGALLDQIFANGSKELRKAAEKLLAQQREIQNILNEHDYTGAVDRSTRSNFDRLGFLKPAVGVRPDSKEGLQTQNTSFSKLTTKARTSLSDLYQIDPESSGFRDRFLNFISVANDGFDFSKLKVQELKALYLELIKYTYEYSAAQKKEDDERDKLNTYRWQNTDEYKEFQEKLPGMEQYADIMGSYRNSAQRMGMKSVSATDPELALMQARLDFAKQYYKFLEAHEATDNQKAEARRQIMESQAAYAKKLTSDMFEQYNALMGFMSPLQTFGESVGDAFATMTENASEGRKALRAALKQMIKSFATNTLQMISQQQIDRAQTTAHYTQLLLMQQAFGTAQLTGETAIGTAKTDIKRNLDISEEQQEEQHQKVLAALRSAGIFGWCVSTLGPIAGPIAYSAMMAILMGLINFAVGKIGGNPTNVENAKATNQKVVSGMLTYDSGNVQDLRPYVSDSGELFWAKPDDGKPHEGVNLLTMPTATTINGQPALVAENGPELVIGRETTQAMMMNNPALLKALVAFDRNHSGRHAYDAGNVSQAAADSTTTDAVVSNNTATNVALLQAINALLQRLDQPIEAKIDMYGRGKLYDSMTRANQFMKNK